MRLFLFLADMCLRFKVEGSFYLKWFSNKIIHTRSKYGQLLTIVSIWVCIELLFPLFSIFKYICVYMCMYIYVYIPSMSLKWLKKKVPCSTHKAGVFASSQSNSWDSLLWNSNVNVTRSTRTGEISTHILRGLSRHREHFTSFANSCPSCRQRGH